MRLMNARKLLGSAAAMQLGGPAELGE